MRYSTTYLINKEKGKDDGRLRCRVRVGKDIVSFCVGYRVNIEGWNTDTQRCRRGSMHGKYTAQKINAEIDRIDAKIASILVDADDMTAERFRQLYNQSRCEVKGAPLAVDMIDKFIESECLRWSDATTKKFVTLKHHIRDYASVTTIEDITTQWLSRYTAHLSPALSNRSINKELKNIRWWLNWSAQNGYKVDDDARVYNPKLKTSQKIVVYLEWHELMNVYSHQFNNLHHDEVRDAFCLSCFTGLRYSDVKALMRCNVSDSHIGVTTIKTGELIYIPLNKYAKAILDKYKDNDINGHALPVCNICEANQAIKEVMRACEIDSEIMTTEYRGNKRIDKVSKKYDLITTHAGRKTFVCNALMLGISAEVVMSITGHRSYASMRPYIAVADNARIQAMSLFDNH